MTSHLDFSFANIVQGSYRYMLDLVGIEACIDPTPFAPWAVFCPPICLNNWSHVLASHPDQRFAAYIFNGFSAGFHIGYDRSLNRLRSRSSNHPSASCNPRVVQDRIATEVELGRLVGPIPQCYHMFVHTSPIGLVPKKGQAGRWRMIVDLSSPSNYSVNDGISRSLCSFSYASVDDAVRHILELGRGTLLSKVDLKDAYRFVPIHPHDVRLLAVSWQGSVYIDRALPFGLRSAPKVFSAISDMLAWAFFRQGLSRQVHYLDDFLFLSSPGSISPLPIALGVLGSLGIPVATHKVEGPSPVLTFLGIQIDTLAMELRLPPHKVNSAADLVAAWQSKEYCRRRELESLLGHLSHAASVVRPGRTFLRELFNLLSVARRPHYFVRITRSARADLAWWHCFLRTWNGSSFLPLPTPSSHVYSDAASSYGCGAFSQGLGWFSLVWPDSWQMASITSMELLPVVLAVAMWGSHWSGQHVQFHSDNTGVVGILSTRTARSPLQMHLLRCFSFFVAVFGLNYSISHVPGPMNDAADALSRNNVPYFLSLYPQTPQVAVPTTLLNLLILTKPDWGSTDWTSLFIRSLATVLPNRHQVLMRQGNVII